MRDRQFAGDTQAVPFRYTIREHLEQIGDPAGTTYPFSARYAYHPNGTVAEAEFYSAGSPATAKRYRYVFGTTSYDALNRLKSADYSFYSSGWQSTLAHDLAGIGYDLAGNITALQRYRETGSLIDNLTYSNATTSNRLNSVSDAVGATTETWDAETGSFSYDANGNLKTAPAPYAITAVTYDHQNLALSLTSNGTTTAYRYNEAGQRITKQVGTGNTEVYLLDGATSLGVFTVNSSGSPTSWFFNVLAGDKVVGRQPNTGNRRYYHTDLLGSTRAVVEGATVVESYDFEPWGLLMPGRTLAGPTKEGFTSKERDAESGLDYFGARYYMAALARWTSVDPLAGKHPEWSPYNYVLNNPLMLVDPDGRQVAALALLPPEFHAGVASGAWSGVKASAVGLYNTFRHPVQTAKGVADALRDPSATLEALASAATQQVDKFVSGDAHTRGEVIGEVAVVVGEILVGSKGLGVATRTTRATRAARLGTDAAEGVAGTRRGSQIDRATFGAERRAYWKAQAENNAGAYSPENLDRMRAGKAPVGADGRPMELHHVDGTQHGGTRPMTRTDHREGDNYRKNHPWLFNDN